MEQMDERLKNELEDENPRAQRAGGAGRRSRESDDRQVTENRELSDDDRIEMFRQKLFNDVLPDLPDIPGYHVCWLSTNHQNDSIAHRQRLGYEIIKAHEIPGMDYVSIKTGSYDGGVGINEMVAFKLPMSLYQAYMQEAHHAAPARDEAGIASQVDAYRESASSQGGEIIEGDGMAELRRSGPSRGKFSD